MENYIQFAYLISSFIAILAMIPQLRQVIRVKHSKELNINTWAAWAACQVVSLVYAISVKATAYAIVSVIWILMYLIMVLLIARYKYNVPLVMLNAKTKVLEQVTSIGTTPIQSEQLSIIKNKVNDMIKSINKQP